MNKKTLFTIYAYNLLLQKKLIRKNEVLSFSYVSKNNQSYEFKAKVGSKGLIIEQDCFTPSYAATYYLISIGEAKPINGWIVWHNQHGQTLSDLYKSIMDLYMPNFACQSRIKSGAAYQEVYYESPPIREAVFFFGAGISISDGGPLQSNIIQLMFNIESELPESCQMVIRFLKTYFICDRQNNIFPTIEKIFGFIDYFIVKNESLNGEYTYERLVFLRELFIKLIHVVINISTKKESDVLRKFWRTIYSTEHNISVITANYDTLAEDAFSILYPLNCYLDYCHALANYNYGHIDPKDWWINPRSPMLTTSLDNYPVRIKFIKIHGSLNWRYCNCCNQLILRPWDDKIDLNSVELQIDQFDTSPRVNGHRCSFDSNQLARLIVPPSYNKNLTHHVITSMLNEAADEIRLAKKVIFIGYSFPDADVHIKAILSKSDISKKKLIIIDPMAHSEAFQRRFKELSPHCTFINKAFYEILNGETLEGLLRPSGRN